MSGSWRAAVTERRAAQQEHRENYRRWYASTNAAYLADCAASLKAERDKVVNPKAVNSGSPWSEGELRIALDPNLSTVEAALILGRTVAAISGQYYKFWRTAA